MKKQRVVCMLYLLLWCFPYSARAEETLTWDACLAEAAKYHPDLISATENVKQQEAGKAISASPLLPQINSEVSAATSKANSSKQSDSYSYGVSGTQLLFDGGKTADNVKAAAENIKASRYNYTFTSSEVRLRLRTAFVRLLKAQEAVDLTRQIYDIRRSNLELITLRYESGLEHKGALLTAQANLAQAVFDIAQNNRVLEVVQRSLAKELGRTRFSPVRVDGVFEVSDTALEKPDFDALAQKNPQMGVFAAQRNAASFGVKSAEASFYPQLSARGGADRTSGHWPPDNDQWNAGIILSLPIFEGGLRVAEVAQAKAFLNQAVESERSTKDGIVVALEQTWAALQDAVENVGVQKEFLNAAEERAKIAEAQYSTGFITFDNWIIIINDLVSAKSSFLDTRANALFAEADWIRAKGETLEYAYK